ncbi:MAG: tRNA (guanosine(18)-2'-O)-methyltransferase TrmH [Pseudomonadota bacterium]|jgi:tRNA (guanosine-2'-O-)-methyltransferase|uniref:tRNA (guanosine(18)-2'-O)-methyltransferase TrmH n=1 Tax=Marisediminitalea aggregata TaxID=634436 RepID=UPI000C5CF253|nr:tRNA (guanosine(18)-2'-O)-methyltransferase TrmH [Marisediminitalea aggregata]MAP22565.1 tRNA (guanosine(18)-2'-O)-methyltransferase TrmH [Alteromonadaceae bacterium]MCP4233479.1 tRNA (guanosine(18)-2'-O)-methyltransferase TrmH [Aestuariibacter sp.]MEC7824451.1 tRNA (guanosine(18)-2'-O)-methyltransferase TrmH [Pseudomonadota bacterium]HBY38992.1 tRNA (guanosine(18)-2'-O)-methyltransferase TrmH [Alteromonas sp.]MAX41215.1 tRNA (guanosine(18)-2'-O)-methyltransferase TrmH [Alteromonadaceae bac|tara:strand:+ start:46711 stop:47415 length:705 start_codon:yes stop_codon:yes gene_type:complete
MTPERYQRIREMLAKRQTDLTVCLENVHKPHNVSAVVRTCDAIGIHKVHAVWENQYRVRSGTAMGSQQWVNVDTHENVTDAIGALKAQNMQVLVTHLSDKAVDFRDIDYTKPTAILFGQEKYGVTDEAIAMCDQDIVIPMVGMVQSLNVSVAAALVLYEAQRQRQIAGMYDVQHLSEEECQRMLFEGGYPVLTKVCKRKGIPYPPIDEQGQIAADDSWWQQMQLSTRALASLNA